MGIRKILLALGLLVILGSVSLVGLSAFGMGSLLAAPLAGPGLSIPDMIPADPAGSVVIPITFTSGGAEIASVIFSIDYDERYLTFDPAVPDAVDFNLPSGLGFVSECTLDAADTDGEIDCYITQMIPPLDPLPDGVVLELILQVGNPASPVVAKVGFSSEPYPSFGDTEGQSASPGLIDDGSVAIGDGLLQLLNWLPILFKASPYTPPPATASPTPTMTLTPYIPSPTPTSTGTLSPTATPTKTATPTALKTATATPTKTPTPTTAACTNVIINGGFESTTAWVLPITEYTAGYSTAQAHTGSWSMRTGIVDPKDEIFSYSEAQQLVYIPSDTDSATLGFWIYPITDEDPALASLPSTVKPYGRVADGLNLADDLQYALVLYGGYYYFKWSDLRDSQAWEYRTVSLAEFAGAWVTIDFGTFNNGYNGVTAMYVDDVTLTICR